MRCIVAGTSLTYFRIIVYRELKNLSQIISLN
jgi:hypothetical protein